MAFYQILGLNAFGQWNVVLSTHRSRDAAVRRLNEVRKYTDATLTSFYK